MANPRHLEILESGAGKWSQWREENPVAIPDLSEADLSGSNLARARLWGANFWLARLTDADLSGADLSGADLSGARLSAARLSGANLSRANLSDARLSRAELAGAILTDANLSGTILSRAELSRANLWRAKLPSAILSDANLSRANLSRANLSRAELSRAIFLGANLSRADLSDAFLTGAELSDARLADADLSGAILSRADLSDAILTRANLSRANLSGTELSGTELARANLSRANLSRANLSRANLSYADLSYANLSDANLSGTELSGTELSGSLLSDTIFGRLDLTKARGLEKARHDGPSTVSFRTLEINRGELPEVFLKGCGLPDWLIAAANLFDPNLRPDQVIDISYEISELRASNPIVPLSVFISYNRDDQGFVEKLERWFDKDRIRSWRDLEDMNAGPWEHQVDRAIGLQKTVVLVLSERSIQSKWVKAEVERAQEVREELERRSDEPVHVLCPVALDNAWWEEEDRSWPRVLRMEVERYNILDFSRWGSDAEFEAQYEKLKTGLGIYYRK